MGASCRIAPGILELSAGVARPVTLAEKRDPKHDILEPRARPASPAAALVGAMSFYDSIEPAKSLDAALDPARYGTASADWRLVLTDIERSTEAIAQGHHKVVNMIAAACIAAARNACAGQEIPFSFGGGGATLLIPPDRVDAVLAALAGVQASARLAGLTLRVGAMTVADLGARGHQVMVARYEVAPGIIFAMFRGGGVGFLERVLKGQEPDVPASFVSAPTAGADPDLTGLSCRFEPIASRGGCTVSLVVAMLEAEEDYRPVLSKVLEIAGENLRPTSAETLAAAFGRTWLPSRESVEMELDALHLDGMASRAWQRLQIVCGWLAGQVSLRFGVRWGDRDFRRELEEKVRNSDFAKADDALQMIVDCTPEELARLRSYLTELEAAGVLVFGLHVSDSALMTCLVDSARENWHVHFIDGAGGGYTHAATAMKAKLAGKTRPVPAPQA
jgi:PAS domain-containing protein